MLMQRFRKKVNGDCQEYEQCYFCGMRGTEPQYRTLECVNLMFMDPRIIA